MISIIGKKLQQYDLNRKVELIAREGTTLEKVTFSRGGIQLETPILNENGLFVAIIPNILLKSFGTISVKHEGFDELGNEVEEKITFYVDEREKPDDYVYVETTTLNNSLILNSSSEGSNKKFELTIDDNKSVNIVDLETGEASLMMGSSGTSLPVAAVNCNINCTVNDNEGV